MTYFKKIKFILKMSLQATPFTILQNQMYIKVSLKDTLFTIFISVAY